MNNSGRPLIALIGAGHMGTGIALRLQQHGLAVLTTLDGRSAATRARVESAGIRTAKLAALHEADILLSVVPPSMATGVARTLVAEGVLDANGPLFVDCNAISPDTMHDIDALVRAAGARCVDAAIVGAPPDAAGTRTPVIYAAGESATALRLLGAHGLDVQLLDAPVGAASGLKLCFAAVSKGLTALVTQAGIKASQAGFAAPLHGELNARLGSTLAWASRQAAMLDDKSYRWVGEMEEIAHFLRDIPGAGQMFLGAAQFYAWLDREKAAANSPLATAGRFFNP